MGGALGTTTDWARIVARAAIVNVLGFFWVALFWFRPARSWPVYEDVYRLSDRIVAQLTGWSGHFNWALKSWIFVLVPIGVLFLFGKKPTALGMGRMARYGWRILLVSFVVSLPVLVWLGLRPGMHAYYAGMFRPDGWKPILANAIVIVVEHMWIEGVLLALALPGGGFAHDEEDPPREGRLAFLGFGQPAGGTTLWTWLGVPPTVLPALIGQALVFGAVHAGKDVGELLSAFPGGFGLGLLTYRIRSVWPSVLLHVGTGAVVLLTILLSR